MANIQHYDIGDYWQPQATFTVAGAATDPTNITVRQQDPAGTETIIANNVAVAGLNASSTPVAKTATGVLKLNPGVQFTSAGYWFVRFEGTGAAAASEEHQAIVDPSEFTSNGGIGLRALVGLAETKDWLQRNQIDTGSDLELVRVINDISDRLHVEAEREFKVSGTNPQTRTFPIETLGATQPRYVDGDYMGEYGRFSSQVEVGDLASFTQVQIISSDWTTVLETVPLGSITAYPTVRQEWEPIRRLDFARTVTRLAVGMRVAVLGNWGFPAVPGSIRQAALDAIAAVMDRDVEHYRQDFTTPASTEGGTTIMVGGSQRILSMPPAALAAAWAYRDRSVR